MNTLRAIIIQNNHPLLIMILMLNNDNSNWCALEIWLLTFSGKNEFLHDKFEIYMSSQAEFTNLFLAKIFPPKAKKSNNSSDDNLVLILDIGPW